MTGEEVWKIGERSNLVHRLVHRVNEAVELAEALAKVSDSAMDIFLDVRRLRSKVIFEKDLAKAAALALAEEKV